MEFTPHEFKLKYKKHDVFNEIIKGRILRWKIKKIFNETINKCVTKSISNLIFHFLIEKTLNCN
jgi:hypothetical protein